MVVMRQLLSDALGVQVGPLPAPVLALAGQRLALRSVLDVMDNAPRDHSSSPLMQR
jgi:hypothetical protein